MNLYSCKVRLGGEIHNEVFIKDATPADIQILRRIHGMDAVLDIKHTGQEERDYDQELDRLMRSYSMRVEHAGEEVPLVAVLFPYGKSFPQVVAGVELIAAEPEKTSAPEAKETKTQTKQAPSKKDIFSA